jgi:hypothetical protein
MGERGTSRTELLAIGTIDYLIKANVMPYLIQLEVNGFSLIGAKT